MAMRDDVTLRPNDSYSANRDSVTISRSATITLETRSASNDSRPRDLRNGRTTHVRSPCCARTRIARVERRRSWSCEECGLASEVVAHAFADHEVDVVNAFYDPANVRSERLLVRVGFTLAGRSRIVPGLERLMRSSAAATMSRRTLRNDEAESRRDERTRRRGGDAGSSRGG
jgi:hypothetical protein